MLFSLVMFGIVLFCGNSEAATPKKAIAPQVAPLYPSIAATSESALEPLIPTQVNLRKPGFSKGIFGRGINTDLAGSVIFGARTTVFCAIAKLTLNDPLFIGAKLGLADDAVEYKIGGGLAYGNDSGSQAFYSFPIVAEAVMYLKENSLFGLDPYIGGGFNLNIIGTDTIFSGLGYQLFGGVLLDLGSELGRTGISIGYQSIRVGTIRFSEGLTLSISHPIIF